MENYPFKIRDGYPKNNCADEWNRHRKFKWIVWGLFAGWIPYGFCVVAALNWLQTRSEVVFVILLVPYLLAFVIIGNIVSAFRCPRCGSRFYAWGPWGMGHNGFARKCRNCFLRKWDCSGCPTSTSNPGELTERLNLLHEALKLDQQRDAAHQLARLGGSEPNATAPPRRRWPE